jgi:hypothetical protein
LGSRKSFFVVVSAGSTRVRYDGAMAWARSGIVMAVIGGALANGTAARGDIPALIDACSDGMVRTEESQWVCCWPGQRGDAADGTCSGVPHCPPGWTEAGGRPGTETPGAQTLRTMDADSYTCRAISEDTPIESPEQELERLCLAGDDYRCDVLGEALVWSYVVPHDMKYGRQLLEAACDRGYVAACVHAAGAQPASDPPDRERELAERGCRGRDVDACALLARSLAYDAPTDPHRAAFVAYDACEIADDAPRPAGVRDPQYGRASACEVIGALELDGSAIRRAPEAGHLHLGDACGQNVLTACARLADEAAAGRVPGVGSAEVLDLYARACNGDVVEACDHYARHQPDPSLAVLAWKHGCWLGSGAQCIRAEAGAP